MQQWQGKRPVAVVTAYVRPDGIPAFALNEVEVTQDERENGVHYELVEAQLGQVGYEEPLIHFDDIDAPSFLVLAVRQYLESLNRVRSQPEPVFPF